MIGLPPPDPQVPQTPKTPEELKALLAQGVPVPTPSPAPTGSRTPEELKALLAGPPAPSPLPHLNLTLPSGGPINVPGLVSGAQSAFRKAADFTTDVAIPAVGATVGGSLGFARGGWAGDVAGSMVGQAAGDVAGIVTEQALGGQSVTSEKSQRRFAQIPENALIAGGVAAVGGPIARGASAATRFLFSPITTTATLARQTMKPGMEEASRYVEGQVMPHEVSKSPMLKFLGNLVEGAPATQAQYQAFLAKRRDLFLQKAEGLITAPGPRVERQAAGEVIRGAKIGETAGQYADLTRLAETRGAEAMDAAGRQAHDILQTGMTDAQRLTADAEVRRGAAQRAYDTAVAESASTWGDFGDTIGARLGREPMGERTLQLLTAAHDAARQEASAIYNRVWEATQGTQVSITPLVARAAALRAEAGKLPGQLGVSGRAGRATGTLTAGEEAAQQAEAAFISPAARQTLEQTASMTGDPRALNARRVLDELDALQQQAAGTGTLTPQQLHRLKSLFGQAGFAESGGRSFEKGEFKQLWEAADQALQQLPPETYATIKTADALHQSMVETFEEGALATLAQKAPKDVLAMVLGHVRTGGEKDVATLLQKIGPEGTQAVRAEVWHSLTTAPNGTPKTPKEFLAAVKKLDAQSVKALFGGMADTLPTLQQQTERRLAAEAALGPAEKAAAGLEKAAGVRATEATKAADTLLVRTEGAVVKAHEDLATRGARELDRLHALPTENLVAASLKDADEVGAAKLRTLVGEDGWKKVQSVDLQRIFGRYEEASGAPLLTPKALVDQLNRRGEASFVAAHSQGEWNQLQVFARAWEKLAKGEAGSTGKMMIQLRTPAAVASLATGGALYLTTGGDISTSATIGMATGGAVLLTPKLLATIFQSSKMRTELLKGMLAKTRKDQPLVIRAGVNLLRQLAAAGALGQAGKPGTPGARVVETGPTGGRGGGPPTLAFGAGGRAGGPPPIFTAPGTGGRSGGAVPVGQTTLPQGLAGLGLDQPLPTVATMGRQPNVVGTPPPPVKK